MHSNKMNANNTKAWFRCFLCHLASNLIRPILQIRRPTHGSMDVVIKMKACRAHRTLANKLTVSRDIPQVLLNFVVSRLFCSSSVDRPSLCSVTPNASRIRLRRALKVINIIQSLNSLIHITCKCELHNVSVFIQFTFSNILCHRYM